MPQYDDSRSQLNSDSDQRVAWLQLELELDPAPVLVLAEAARPTIAHCPMCHSAALAGADGWLQCAKCGMEIDL